MACEVPPSALAARPWNSDMSTDAAVNAQLWAEATSSCSYTVASVVTFSGSSIFTFSGLRIKLF